jgi:hypothetical protein
MNHGVSSDEEIGLRRMPMRKVASVEGHINCVLSEAVFSLKIAAHGAAPLSSIASAQRSLFQ